MQARNMARVDKVILALRERTLNVLKFMKFILRLIGAISHASAITEVDHEHFFCCAIFLAVTTLLAPHPLPLSNQRHPLQTASC
jgi:hypothetical protein